jgi:hypothetical protein
MQHYLCPRHILVALLLVILTDMTQAQVTLHTYAARLENEDPNATPKPLFVAIVDEYSTADVAHDRATQMLTITTSFQLEQAWISGIAADAGFRMTGLWLDGADIFFRKVSVDEASGMATAPSGAESNTHDHGQ